MPSFRDWVLGLAFPPYAVYRYIHPRNGSGLAATASFTAPGVEPGGSGGYSVDGADGAGGGGMAPWSPPTFDIGLAEAEIRRGFEARRRAIQNALRQALGAQRQYIEEGARYFGAEHGDVMGFSEEALAKGLAAYGASRDEIAQMLEGYKGELARAAALADPMTAQRERLAQRVQKEEGGQPPTGPEGQRSAPRSEAEKVDEYTKQYIAQYGEGIPIELFGGEGGSPTGGGFNYQVRGEHEPPPGPGETIAYEGPLPGVSAQGGLEALGREGGGYRQLVESLASAYHDRGMTQRQAMDEYLRAMAGAYNLYAQRESGRLATAAQQRLAELQMQQQLALANLYAQKAQLEYQAQLEQDPLRRRLIEQEVEMNDLRLEQARREASFYPSYEKARGAIVAFDAASGPKRPPQFYEDLKRQYLDPILNDPAVHPEVKAALETAYRAYLAAEGTIGLDDHFANLVIRPQQPQQQP